MAASLTRCLLKNKTTRSCCLFLQHFRSLSGHLNETVFMRNYATTSEDVKSEEAESKDSKSNEDVHIDEEQEISVMAKRDVSRLKNMFKHRMYHCEQPPEFTGQLMQTSRLYKRQVYGRMGKNSGYDPSLFYPFEDELKEQLEERELFEPSLEELVTSAEAKRDALEREQREKEQYVLKQMAKMPKLIEDYRTKVRKQQDETRKHDSKIKELLSEAREFYGYHVDHRDPRFAKMVEEKEAQAQEEKKIRKKKEKQEAALQQMLALQEKARKEREEIVKREREKQEKEEKEQQASAQ